LNELHLCPTCLGAAPPGCATCRGAGSLTVEQLSQLARELYDRTDEGVVTRAAQLQREARGASFWLFAVAILWTFIFLILGIIVSADLTPQKRGVLGSVGFLTALFWALYVWSRWSPLMPAIVGLVIYCTLWCVDLGARLIMAAEYRDTDAPPTDVSLGPDCTTIPRLLIVAGLAKAVIVGLKHRRLAALAAKPKPPEPPAPAAPAAIAAIAMEEPILDAIKVDDTKIEGNQLKEP
jgi:hypothetical protein